MTNAKRLYRVNEFLAAFGIGRTKFYSEVKAGRLRVVRLGERATRVLVEDAERWAQGLTHVPIPAADADCQGLTENNGEQQRQKREKKRISSTSCTNSGALQRTLTGRSRGFQVALILLGFLSFYSSYPRPHPRSYAVLEAFGCGLDREAA